MAMLIIFGELDYPGLSYLSIRSPATLKRIVTSAGYHIPATTAGLEVDPIEEMVLQTGLERAGIFNTKSGTWLREMALHALPPLKDKTDPSIYAEKMDALRELGLIDGGGKPTWFTGGKPDELKMLKIVAEHAKGIPVERRALLERYLFGAQGGGAVGVLSDSRLLPQLHTMEKEAKDYRQGTDYFEYMYQNSPVQTFNQAWVDVQRVLMDIGEKVLPPVVGLLQAFDAGLKGLESTLGGGTLGTIVAAGLGALAGARVAGAPGAIVGGIVGAAAVNKPSADSMPSATWGDWWNNIKENPYQLFGLGSSRSGSSLESPGSIGLRVIGDCLAPRVLDRDIVVAEPRLPAAGDIAVVWFKGAAMPTIKILAAEIDRCAFPHHPQSEVSFPIQLEQLNPPKKFVAWGHQVECVGRVHSIVRKGVSMAFDVVPADKGQKIEGAGNFRPPARRRKASSEGSAVMTAHLKAVPDQPKPPKERLLIEDEGLLSDIACIDPLPARVR